MSKNLICYVALFLVFGTAAYVALGLGARLEHADAVTKAETSSTSAPSSSAVSQGAHESASSPSSTSHATTGGRDPLVSLLLQVLVVIAAARLCGALFKKMGQPSVIGEMAAGLILG